MDGLARVVAGKLDKTATGGEHGSSSRKNPSPTDDRRRDRRHAVQSRRNRRRARLDSDFDRKPERRNAVRPGSPGASTRAAGSRRAGGRAREAGAKAREPADGKEWTAATTRRSGGSSSPAAVRRSCQNYLQ